MKRLLLLLALMGVFAVGCSKLEEFFESPKQDVIPDTPTVDIEAVDLGLSVKWATCNVGATKPEEYGDYFAWGETSPKEVYDSKTYKYVKITVTDEFVRCEYEDLGNISGTQYDAASVNWGGSWRMPTQAEQQELFDNCTWNWTTQNGVNGMEVTGPNGNSIFLPAAGHRYGSSSEHVGSDGDYWSSTPCEDNDDGACYLYFDSWIHDAWGWEYRSNGRSVRPVSE